MGKHRLPIIILLIVLSLPGLLFWYAFSMPSLFKIARIYPQIRDLPELQQIELDEYQPKSGLKLRAYGYSLTLTGVQTADDKSLDRDISTFYFFGEKKGLMLINPDDENTMGKALYEDKTIRHSIEAFTGRQPESEFECLHMYYSASIKGFSLFNNNRNLNLCEILRFRSIARFESELSEFDRGDIKGFLLSSGTDKPIVEAYIYRQSDLNKVYCITLMNFDLKEAATILSTITFDP